MNKQNRRFGIFALVMLIALVLTGCGGTPMAGAPPGVSGVDVAGLLAKAGKYWSDGHLKEKHIVDLWRLYVTADSKLRLGVSDLVMNNQACYKNVADAEAQISAAAVSTNNQTAIASSLNLSGNDISGGAAVAECVKLNQQVADYVVANRTESRNAYNSMFDAATDYINFVSSSPEVDFMNDLMDTYLDTNKVYDELKKHDIGVSDWTWLPTTALFVSTQDKGLCDLYNSDSFVTTLPKSVQRKFTGHLDSLQGLYESTWNAAANGGRGECRLTRMAALEYMTRDLTSAQTQQNMMNGNDTGAFPTLVVTAKPS